MSGGVDSSLCAHLLKEQGYDVTGVYLECWRAPGCRTDQDRKDALQIALDLALPFQVLDFKQQYRDQVVEYFFQEYAAGRTPNPDVMCNREIKFGLFYQWAMEQGFDFVATGHYAAIDRVHNTLAIPADTHKDQTYFLYVLTKEQLDHTLFPLSGLTKQEVRAQAQQRGLAVADKKDSTGICFIGDINVHAFLHDRLGDNPGDVVDTDGNIIGTHQGLWFYTIGQRHGFTIQAKTAIIQADGQSVDRHNIPPFYVIAKKAATNQLVVGFGAETRTNQFSLSQPHLINPKLTWPERALVRIRHTGALLPCGINHTSNNVTITLDQPVQGIAAGQAAVVYVVSADQPATTLCLCGGVIELETQN